MSEGRPERVRVTGPPRRHAPRARTGDIDDETRLGHVYLGSLLREQLRLALRTIALLVVSVGSLPLAFHLLPRLSAVRVGPVPLAWLLLGALVYPLLVLLGWSYVRRAERNERDFAELMSEADG
ncbi:hypothetical protein [Nocardioides sp. 503]|uniref:hypothetical protein n=1 Tax=Nocardioides sp. 503 TaxID=2508326 RepID=UPI00106FC4FA|nr:hypothetical protein [Nocardioides sp. 503]